MEQTVIAPVHPGRLLLKDFLKPMGITPSVLAAAIKIPQRKVLEIIRGQRAISADIALRLSRFFGMSDGFWMNLQSHYELEVQKDKLGDRLRKEVKVLARV